MNNLEALAKEGKINKNANIKDEHSIIINAPIDKVWEILSDIKKWPEWYSIIKQIDIEDKVKVETKFKWNFNGMKFNAQIHTATKPSTLAWTGKSSWIKSIHVWQFEGDENQTIASLSNSLQGTFTILINKHQKVHNDLIGWLESLKAKAEQHS